VRFLADMGLARSTVIFLQSFGHDAVHFRDQGLQRMGDDLIVQKALAEKRIILTHDLDFSRIIAVSGVCLPSVISFRLADMRPPQVNAYMREVLDRFLEQLESGALISVNEQGIRIRRLPIFRPE
jgi:predicted nuclease of predicted toxin-antitoxin system